MKTILQCLLMPIDLTISLSFLFPVMLIGGVYAIVRTLLVAGFGAEYYESETFKTDNMKTETGLVISMWGGEIDGEGEERSYGEVGVWL